MRRAAAVEELHLIYEVEHACYHLQVEHACHHMQVDHNSSTCMLSLAGGAVVLHLIYDYMHARRMHVMELLNCSSSPHACIHYQLKASYIASGVSVELGFRLLAA